MSTPTAVELPDTRVVNLRTEPYDVYIGRPSRWGNPFVIGRDGSRADVIAKFRTYARGSAVIQNHIQELQGKRLGCYCAPLPCHGDVLREMADATTD
jgi:hypothetical protein